MKTITQLETEVKRAEDVLAAAQNALRLARLRKKKQRNTNIPALIMRTVGMPGRVGINRKGTHFFVPTNKAAMLTALERLDKKLDPYRYCVYTHREGPYRRRIKYIMVWERQ